MSQSNDSGRPIQVAEGIFWVGAQEDEEGLACNPYLIVEGDRAVLIDSGSRTDFAVVMMRILQTGIDPRQIVALIYQHYDPDLCGSMANFIDMCDNPDLRIVSEKCNNAFISFYIHRDQYHLLRGVEDYGNRFPLGQRWLEFIPTPYAHSAGSFATYDPRTGTLFTSDLFGSRHRPENLFLEFDPACFECADRDHCPLEKTVCPLKEMASFHRFVMPCTKALRHAIGRLRRPEVACIAPQHGGVLARRADIQLAMDRLESLEGVGIDGAF